MRTISKYINAIAAAALVTAGFSSCDKVDYPDRYEVADGKPTVYSVRYADRDINITSAYMDEVVCLLGKNLRSITELWFNDQEAILNTSYITDNTLMVSVPKNMPAVQTDSLYMITKSKDTVAFYFKVLPPVPKVNSMTNEWAEAGETVTIYGDFLIDDAATPLKIEFPGAEVDHSKMVFSGSSAVTFPVPEGANPGYVIVTSLSGSGRSKFQYKDSRNILFDWDGSHGGQLSGHGWRNGVIHTPGTDAWKAIDGSYLYFGGAEIAAAASESWLEDNFSFNYWPDTENGYPELSAIPEFADYIKNYGIGSLSIKFELLIPSSSPWSSAGLQIIFTGNSAVTYATATNAYIADTGQPRAIWRPWYTNGGSYDTADKWVTVTVPLADCTFTHEGNTCATSFSQDMLTGLTFFVYHGGIDGTACSPEFAIDNIRVVPNN